MRLLTDTERVADPAVPWGEDTPGGPRVTYHPRNKVWRLKGTFARTNRDGTFICIWAGFEFDLASIPRLLWALLASHELGIVGPLVHDALYRYGGVIPIGVGVVDPDREYTRLEADNLFLEHMAEDGVSRWRRWAAYSAVRTFGGRPWRDQAV